jgi:hypothetical protein
MLRQVRWYNDAYVFSFQDRRWALIPQKPNAQVSYTAHPRQHLLCSAVLHCAPAFVCPLVLANAAELRRLLLSEAVSLYTLVTRMYGNVQVPKPRSGVTLCIHSAEDTIYIYGGYSKVSKRPTCAPVFGVLTAHEHAWSGV